MSDVTKLTQREDFADKSPQEVLEILKEEGSELTDEQLEQVSGGDNWDDIGYCLCPKCDGLVAVVRPNTTAYCRCGYSFQVQW